MKTVMQRNRSFPGIFCLQMAPAAPGIVNGNHALPLVMGILQ